MAVAITHDVDYPELIRPIEVLRVLRDRGVGGLGLAARVATGKSHFWTFREWRPITERLGTRSCFYFMARQGSLLQYAMGTPDDFYDVRAPRFQRLFAELRDAGCEIGLHASFHAHRSADTLRREVQRIAEAAGVECAGNRHHYWHLDPDAPNETLRRHAEAGLKYDSSLGLEYYPGFRRGICHPYRVFHAGTRAPLPIVQLPPAWMDDHFDRRLARNGITDPDAAARALLDAASESRGMIIVDYHSRGMNADFYPRYGPWLERFAEQHFDRTVRGMTPMEIHDAFVSRERQLAERSVDLTARDATSVDVRHASPTPTQPLAVTRFVIERYRADDCAELGRMHFALLGDPVRNGYSLATVGPEFMADAFYRLSLDNPNFHCDVARVDGTIAGFHVFTSEASSLTGFLVKRHPAGLLLAAVKSVLRRPRALVAILRNLRYIGGEQLDFLCRRERVVDRGGDSAAVSHQGFRADHWREHRPHDDGAHGVDLSRARGGSVVRRRPAGQHSQHHLRAALRRRARGDRLRPGEGDALLHQAHGSSTRR